MDKFIHKQKDKFNLEKQVLEQQIKSLNQELSEKATQYIPHLFTYK